MADNATVAAASAAAGFFDFLVNGTKVMFYLKTPQELAFGTGDHVPNYLLELGVPMFFIMIALEWVGLLLRDYFGGHRNTNTHGGARPKTFYRLNDMLVCTTIGSVQTVFSFLHDYLGLVGHVAIYSYLFEHCRLTEVDPKEWVWSTYILLFLARDFGYYWNHRLLHEYHLWWSTHSVHHSGEDYNLATGLRQGALQPLTTVLFQWPVVLLGVPVEAFAAHAHLNTLYQYWIHTDLVTRMPFGLEYILNGPMAHRMHHRYPGNRNYGAVLIIWDRMFGTYEAETERKDAYGLAKQPNTFSAAKLNVNHFKAMSHIGRGDPWKGNWLYRSFARRIKAKWTFSLGALFEPIPPLEKDLRVSLGPSWPVLLIKACGCHDCSAGPATFVGNLQFVGLCTIGTAMGLVAMILQSRMVPADVVAASIASLVVMELGTRIADCSPKHLYVGLLHRTVSVNTLYTLAGIAVTAYAVFFPLSGVLRTLL